MAARTSSRRRSLPNQEIRDRAIVLGLATLYGEIPREAIQAAYTEHVLGDAPKHAPCWFYEDRRAALLAALDLEANRVNFEDEEVSTPQSA
jgi:hypothetical protein